jgi:hypothetical protein
MFGTAVGRRATFLSVRRGTILDMAYDEDLANRVRELVAVEPGVSEQRMFGGLAFLIEGNMSVAASGQGGLLVRVDPTHAGELIDGAYVLPMVMQGREMRGWLHVDPDALRSDRQLEGWVSRGVAYARSLPAKSKPRRPRARGGDKPDVPRASR